MAIIKIKEGSTYIVDQKEYFADEVSDLETIASEDRLFGDYAYVLNSGEALVYVVNGSGEWVLQ